MAINLGQSEKVKYCYVSKLLSIREKVELGTPM